MNSTQSESDNSILVMPCGLCGGAMRLYGIEPHPHFAHTDLRTYTCDACDRDETVQVPLVMPGVVAAPNAAA